jgi:hypothetical protein
MQITDSLNLAIPFGNGMTAYHTSVSRAIYEANYAALHAALAAMGRKGAHYLKASGPNIANLVLKDEGKRDAAERGEEDRTPALLGEIKRLTNVLVPGAAGYDLLPVDAAISMGKLDEEDWGELEAQIVFFTCLVQTARKSDRTMVAASVASIVDGSTTSSAPMVYAASLQTSTKVEPIQAMASSLPV